MFLRLPVHTYFEPDVPVLISLRELNWRTLPRVDASSIFWCTITMYCVPAFASWWWWSSRLTDDEKRRRNKLVSHLLFSSNSKVILSFDNRIKVRQMPSCIAIFCTLRFTSDKEFHCFSASMMNNYPRDLFLTFAEVVVLKIESTDCAAWIAF